MTEQSVVRTAPRPPIQAGGAVAALIPQNLDEAFRVANAIAASGLAPRGVEKPEQVLVAIMAGAELGFAPFQAMQSFAVINGKPNIWGDAIPALLWAKGFELDEWFDDDDAPKKAFCKVTRPSGKQIERTFSVEDARKANLLGKTGPWQTNQKRMLQMRARAFAARDGASDVLRGMEVYEEVKDYTHLRDVTPRASGLMDRLPGNSTGEGFAASNMDQVSPKTEAEAEVSDEPDLDEALDHDDIPDFGAADDAADAEGGQTASGGESSPGQGSSAQAPAEEFPGDSAPTADAPATGQTSELTLAQRVAAFDKRLADTASAVKAKALWANAGHLRKDLERADPEEGVALEQRFNDRLAAIEAEEREARNASAERT